MQLQFYETPFSPKLILLPYLAHMSPYQNNYDSAYIAHHQVKYVAPKPGIYAVDLRFADRDVPESPFEVKCSRPPPDASKCVVQGLETPGSFTVDCTKAGGNGLLEIGASGSYVPVEFVSVKHNGDFTFSVSYDIAASGETVISCKWHGKHLMGSPFTISI